MLSDQLFQHMRTRLAEANLPGFNSDRFQEEFRTKEAINWKYWKVASLVLWQQVFESFRINNAIAVTEQS
jgi:hypothetical protein